MLFDIFSAIAPNEENGQVIHKNIRIIEPGKFDPVTPMLIYQITYTVIFE